MLHCYPPNGLKLHVTEWINTENIKGTNIKTRRVNLIYVYCDNPSLSLTRISQFQCYRKEVHFLCAQQSGGTKEFKLHALNLFQLYQWLSIFFVRRNHDKIVDKIVFEKFTRGEKVNGRRTRKPVSQRWKVGTGRKKQKKGEKAKETWREGRAL